MKTIVVFEHSCIRRSCNVCNDNISRNCIQGLLLYLFVLACTDTNCLKCPTGIAICTECSNGKGADTGDNTCKGKFLVLFKCDQISPINKK